MFQARFFVIGFKGRSESSNFNGTYLVSVQNGPIPKWNIPTPENFFGGVRQGVQAPQFARHDEATVGNYVLRGGWYLPRLFECTDPILRMLALLQTWLVAQSLAICTIMPKEFKRDTAKAMSLFQVSCGAGEMSACSELGGFYTNGDDVARGL